jgi:hypothetical protein
MHPANVVILQVFRVPGLVRLPLGATNQLRRGPVKDAGDALDGVKTRAALGAPPGLDVPERGAVQIRRISKRFLRQARVLTEGPDNAPESSRGDTAEHSPTCRGQSPIPD